MLKNFVWGLLLCLLLVKAVSVAQVTTGTILGTVTDATGGVIPGASVTITNTDTGISRKLATDSGGRYVAPQLTLGNYEVAVESTGFTPVVRKGIVLTLGREAVVDFTLQVGATAESVTVTGEAPLIETTTSTVAGLVSETQMRELPLNARSYEQLAFLEPNVYFQRNSTKSTNVGQTGSLSAAGMRVTANTFVVDGIDVMDTSNNTPGSAAGQMMGVETLREFRVITNNAPAQYGRGVGAVVDVASRSGTNEFHGTVFEFLRNEAVDARSFFEPELQPLKRNQFGAVLGGPIVRDRAFFFTSYEALRQRQTIVRQFIVPTEEAKLGILPAPTPANPNATRTVIVDSNIRPLLAIYPRADFALGGGLGQVGQPFPGSVREDFVTGRVDYQHSQNVSYFGRYNFDDTDKIQPRVGSTIRPWMEGLVSRNQILILGETRLLTPSLVNEFRAGFVRSTPRSRNHLVGSDPTLRSACCPGQMQLQLSASSFQSATVQLANLGSTGRAFENWTGNTYQFTDNLSYVRGAHSLKMGANIEWLHDNINGRTETGLYADTVSYQFQGLEQLLTGNARTFSGSIIPDAAGISGRQFLYGFYLQDDYRVRSNLTLNLGVRYEWASNYSNVHNRFQYQNSLFGDVKSLQKYQYAGRLCAGCVDPRFGFAWDLFSNSKTVLKGGFGIYRSQIVRYLVAFAGGADAASLGGLSLSVDNPSFPDPRVPRPDGSSVIRLNPTGTSSGGAVILPEIAKTPSAMQWNLTLEHAITPSMTARLAYVASHGYHLDSSTFVNTNKYKVCPDASEARCASLPAGSRVFPATGVDRFRPDQGGGDMVMYDFNSYYNSFLATLGQRMSHGLDFQVSYAFSRATDDVTSTRRSGYAVASEPYLVDEQRNIHHGLSGYNMRHRVVSNVGYSFPSLNSQSSFANKLFSGWRLNSIITVQEGTPFTPLIGFDRANSRGNRPTNSQRPSLSPTLNGAVPLCPCTMPASLGGGTQDRPQRYFDPTVFVLPTTGTYGNAGRNIINGPGLVNFDFSLTKETSITERVHLQFRTEAFNLFNNVNFGMPSSIIFETNGAIASSAGLITSTFTEGRQFQFALKLLF